MMSIRPNFPVGDLAQAVDFYQRTLGFEVHMQAPEYGLAILGSGAVELALLATTAGPASAYLEVSDVEAVFEACQAAPDAAVTGPPTTQPWGLRDFAMHDPWGNMLGIGQRLAG